MRKLFLALCIFSVTSFAYANTEIKMHLVDKQKQGKYVGTITLSNTAYGVLLTPKLFDLPQGLHGFHLHENASCQNKGLSAGGHFDPKQTGKHLGPYNDQGHLGDLPILYVDKTGQANASVLAPRLKPADLKGHALIIHLMGDNYADTPAKLGGGGSRIACGIIVNTHANP